MRFMVTLPIMRAFLVIAPLLMAGRFMATALWATPTGSSAYTPEMHVYVYTASAAICVLWSIFHTNMKMNAWLGTMAALVCMYRGVNALTLDDRLGTTSYVAFVFWVSFSVLNLLVSMMGVQWCILYNMHTSRERKAHDQ